MKKIFIVLILCILILPVTTLAESSFYFERNTNVDLKITCLDTSNNYCSNTTLCNITSFYPDHTLLINNKRMTPYPPDNPTYFNYTFNSSVIGEYYTLVRCNGSLTNYTTFIFEVSSAGEKVGMEDLFLPFILILLVAVFLTISVIAKDRSITIIFMVLGLLLSLLVLNLLITMSGSSDVMNNLGIAYQVGLWTTIFFIGYIIIRFILETVKSVKEKKEDEEAEEWM